MSFFDASIRQSALADFHHVAREFIPGRVVVMADSSPPPRNPETASAEPIAVDLQALAAAATSRIAWSTASEDLNINLLVLTGGEEVAAHVNTEVDVLLVGIAGSGIVVLDGRQCPVVAGQSLLLPKGAERAIHASDGRFAYLTCHRRRSGLMPTGRRPRSSGAV